MFRKKHFLSVVAIFKNEAHCMDEWLSHYINEGVDHFYLIDNGSTDDYQSILNPFIKKGFVTLKRDNTKWSQVLLYNKYFLSKKKLSKWIIVCDFDEFIYSRDEFSTTRKFLESLPREVGLIRIPWKMFGSSGLQQQPHTIIPNFVKRSQYKAILNPGMRDENYGQSKTIVKGEFLKKIDIHFCEIKENGIVVGAHAEPLTMDDPFFQEINEELLNNSKLHLNHYPIQSREWFLNVKAKRGAADWELHENVRDIKYFEEYDKTSNKVIDEELAQKKY